MKHLTNRSIYSPNLRFHCPHSSIPTASPNINFLLSHGIQKPLFASRPPYTSPPLTAQCVRAQVAQNGGLSCHHLWSAESHFTGCPVIFACPPSMVVVTSFPLGNLLSHCILPSWDSVSNSLFRLLAKGGHVILARSVRHSLGLDSFFFF